MNKGPETEGTGDLHFYYNRNDRQKGLPSSLADRIIHRDRYRGLWAFVKRNRRLGMILADISVICLIGLLLVPFLHERIDQSHWEDIRFSFTAFAGEGQVYVNLEIIQPQRVSRPDIPVKAVFFVGEGGVEERFFNLPGPGERESHRLTLEGMDSPVKVVLTWQEGEKNLLQKLKL